MRKVFSGILATAIVLSLCATASFAAGPRCGRYFVDADGDGVCDNYVSGQRGCGRYFVDADGDGVCDNYMPGQGRGGCGFGGGCGFRGGRGR